MKSFFKKLAFVMAFAMVVSVAAPAAVASAADDYYAALQNGSTKIESINLTLGETEDLKFIGAAKGWQSLAYGWVSANPAIATVDPEWGIVTPVSAGETTVTFKLAGYPDLNVKVTVVDPNAGDDAEAVTPGTGLFVAGQQMSEISYKVKLNTTKAYTEKQVKLFRIFDSIDGDIDVSWPIDEYECKDGYITFAPFVDFEDGARFKLVVDDETFNFTTEIPELEEVQFAVATYGTDDAGTNGKALLSDEETGDETIVYLGYKLTYKGMDVTELFKDDVEVSFQVTNYEEDDEIFDEDVDFDEEGMIVFYAKHDLEVIPVVTYEGEEDDETIAPSPVTVVPTALEEYEFKAITDWAFYKSGDFNWNKKSVRADEAGYKIVLKLVDSRGNYFVTNGAAVASGLTLVDDSVFEDAGYSFEYYSTNTDMFLVDMKTAEITTYLKGDAVFYVTLVQDVEDEDEPVKKNVFAKDFSILEPNRFNGLSAGADLVLMADAVDTTDGDSWENDYISGTVTVKQVDLDNKQWEDNTVEYTVTPSDKDALSNAQDPENYSWKYTVDSKGACVVEVNAMKLYEQTGKTKLTFTVTETESKESDSFTVTIRKPEWKDSRTEISKTNFENGYIQDGTTFTDTDVVKNTVLIDQIKGTSFYKVALSSKAVTLAYSGNTAQLNYSKQAMVSVDLTSDGYAVQQFATSGLAANRVTNVNWYKTTDEAMVGQRYVALYKGSTLVQEATNGLYKITTADNKINIDLVAHKLDAESNPTDELEFAKDGTYTLYVYTVTGVNTTKNVLEYDAKTSVDFKVTDGRKNPALLERVAIETEESIANDGEANAASIVASAFTFKLGSSNWFSADSEGNLVNIDPSVIGEVDYRTNDEYVIIKGVTFFVPVDGSKELEDGEDYYVVEVNNINMSVRLPE